MVIDTSGSASLNEKAGINRLSRDLVTCQDLDQIVDSVKTEKPNGAEFIVKEFYRFFLNGWLKEYYYEEAADIGFYQSIETHYIRCISSYMRI